MNPLDLTLAILSVGALVPATYLGWLTLWSARLPLPSSSAARIRFDLIVPAHNEAVNIAGTVKNLLAVDYPEALRRVWVVADNCTDDTAARATEAGATVLERRDDEKRGKGYALAHAFERSLKDGRADAVVVVDADTLVSSNLLRAFAARLERGAHAAQAHYGVSNPDASWRTRLMAIAFGMFHILRSLARERLGVSCGLRGNGMCFSHKLIREVPHDAFSVVEDLEYGIRAARAGHRVVYAHEAHVLGEMVSSEKASRSQRRRWEGGRLLMAREHAWPLLRDGLRKGSGLLLDLAMDVLVPPLSSVAAASVAGLFAALAGSFWTGERWLSVWPFAAASLFVCAYVLRGWRLSGSGLRGLAALAYAPLYVVWKLALLVMPRSGKRGEWVRTTREAESRLPEPPK